MNCKQCGLFFPGRGDLCPSCQVANHPTPPAPATTLTPTTTPQSNRKKVDWESWRILILIIAIPIVASILFNVISNNAGTYSFEDRNAINRQIEYRGKLKKLVNNDSDLLNDFLDGDSDAKVFGEKNVTAIYCKDYTLTLNHPTDEQGIVDLYDDCVTFFESGLREININDYRGEYYEKFREDFDLIIEDKKNNHRYYFQDLSDASTWLRQNF